MIEIKGCSYDYGTQIGIKDVSLTLRKGQVLGLLGPNGAGKTTLCRCLSGFVKPQRGEVTVLGVNPFTDHKHHIHVGYVSGELAFLENMSALEHIKLIASLKGCSLDKAYYYMKVFDFSSHKKIKTYSKGNKQKLGLILALMHSPQCLILDEPSSGLDPMLQGRLVEELLKLKEAGVTMLLSSHYFDEILRVCDDVAVLKAGELISVFRVEELTKNQLKKIHVEVVEPILWDDFAHLNAALLTPNKIQVEIKGYLSPLFDALKSYTVIDFKRHEQTLEAQFFEIYERGK